VRRRQGAERRRKGEKRRRQGGERRCDKKGSRRVEKDRGKEL
jgi:hypothetical protein